MEKSALVFRSWALGSRGLQLKSQLCLLPAIWFGTGPLSSESWASYLDNGYNNVSRYTIEIAK